MKHILDIWDNFLLNDKAMVIFALWTFGIVAFWRIPNPETIIGNIISGLLGMVVGSAMATGKDKT